MQNKNYKRSFGQTNSYVAQKPVRRRALVTPWGVGAMLDFPGDESLM